MKQDLEEGGKEIPLSNRGKDRDIVRDKDSERRSESYDSDKHKQYDSVRLLKFRVLELIRNVVTLKIATRFVSLFIVLIFLYYSISLWWNEEKNREIINIQYFLTTSVFGFYASCAFGDYLHTVANIVEEKLKTKNDLIGNDKKEANEHCRMPFYTKFMFSINAGGGALVIMLTHVSVDGVPNSTWGREVITPIAWIASWFISYFMVHALTVDVLAYQNNDFVEFVRLKTVPICGGMAAVQLFAIMACLFQGEMARNDPHLEITTSWSSGQGCINVQYIILMMETLAVYFYGAGHIKVGNDEEQNFQEVLNYSDGNNKNTEWVQLGLRFIKRSFLVGVVCFFISFALLFTTFDMKKYLVFVYLIVLFNSFVMIAVVLTRAESPARLGALLKRYNKKYHAFISHAQGPGGDQVECIARELKRLGFNIWRDMEKVELTVETMKKGIDESLFVIVFLTKDEDKSGMSLNRTYPRMEMHHAIREGYAEEKRMIFVMETDVRHFGFGTEMKFLFDELDQRHPADHPKLPGELVYNTGDNKGFKDIIEGTEVMMYERRSTYSEAFYTVLKERLSKPRGTVRADFDFDFYISFPLTFGFDIASGVKNILSDQKHKVCDFPYSLNHRKIESFIDKSEHVVVVITTDSLKDDILKYTLFYLIKMNRKAFLIMDSVNSQFFGYEDSIEFQNCDSSLMQYMMNLARKNRQVNYRRGDNKKALQKEFYTDLMALITLNQEPQQGPGKTKASDSNV